MKKLLVANRGEIACRVIRSARKLGIATLAVCSDVDRGALHTSLADEVRELGGETARESYLDAGKLLAAARHAGADAVHPGYGFLSENASFADAVIHAGLVWVGPTPDTIRAMGDKQRAREIAESVGMPLLPGSRRFEPAALVGLEEAAEAIGYPLLVKACGGGGGIGMQRIESPERLRRGVESTQTMAARSFGDGSVFLERFIANARHIEIQVFGLGDGRVVHLFDRECSIQRRFQKVIEEAVSPVLSPATRSAMAGSAVALASHQRYQGAGTVEFVYDDDRGDFFFLEMNTRIQVEHPVTEMICGVDLVGMQLRLAAGEGIALTQEDIHRSGHAIEMRIYAENPNKNFMPSPGRLDVLSFPAEGDGVRVDTGVRQGDTISHFYDPMIAKLIVHGQTRGEAIARGLDALQATRLEGVASNLQFLRRVLQHPEFVAGRTTTGFIPAHMPSLIG